MIYLIYNPVAFLRPLKALNAEAGIEKTAGAASSSTTSTSETTSSRASTFGASIFGTKRLGRALISFNSEPINFPSSLLCAFKSRSEERRVGKECRSRWSA